NCVCRKQPEMAPQEQRQGRRCRGTAGRARGRLMREACLQQVYELAKTDDRIFFIGSDLGVNTLDQFKREMPERFIMEGVSEQHIVGMASGLALEGKIVYVN